MKNKQRQDNKGLERLGKAFRVSSIIFNILLFVGGVAMVSFMIWLVVNFGEFLQ